MAFMWRRLIRVVKWFALTVVVVAGLLFILYRDLVVYGFRQGKGQLHIIWNAKPVEIFLNDPAFPDSLKAKLRLIEEVRRFAIDSLGLKDTRNYKTLYDQKGQEIMWVVTASEPFRLEAKEWIFPVVGAVPYKGFFDSTLALAEQTELEAEGWDVSVRNPGGWSTLGWFRDPILSGMLLRNEGDLAGLIIHEMVHATIFVKDSVDFNENLASFIGDQGAELFMRYQFGMQSPEYHRYVQEANDYERYVDHILRGSDYLDSVYAAIDGRPMEEKIKIKETAIRKIMSTLDSLSFQALTNPSQKLLNTLPNNAYFMSFRRYQLNQDEFWEEWKSVFKGDLRAYIQELIARYPYL
jgi:predicted aminopeptidase